MGNAKIFGITPVAGEIPFDNATNGWISTDVQSAIQESTHTLFAAEVTGFTDLNTTSTTDSLLTGMTITPAAGTYLVWFSTSITSNLAGAAVSTSFYVGGVQKADSLRKIIPLDGGALSVGAARGIMQFQGLITVNGSQAIEIRWSTSGGTATCGPRTMNTLRVA